jgi:Na+-transporting NADH:ubiquinone oxidoreductase subunit F
MTVLDALHQGFEAAKAHGLQWAESVRDLWLAHWLEISLGVGVFVAIVLVLTALVVLAQTWLMPGGLVRMFINGDRVLEARAGMKLIQSLAEHGIYLPSACGGKGTCGECKTLVIEGAGTPLPTESSRLGRTLIRQGYRLSCQVVLKRDIHLAVSPELLETRTWIGTVRSNRSLTPLIKELVLELPAPAMRFKAGQYILLEAPPHHACFRDFAIDERFRDEWDRWDWWRHDSELAQPTTRSYSMANCPDEGGIVILNVRLALPPHDRPDAPPGKVSAYAFSLAPGQRVKISGAFGDFRVRSGEHEMIFVGGGAGMAPLRSMILDQLERVKTRRKMSFWYGARGVREIFYGDLFDRLAQEHPNFTWLAALSEPRQEDHWDGPTGFIHHVLHERYLRDHPAPEDCDYYLCGPPLMLKAMLMLLEQCGVEPDHIFFDDFGG